MISATTFRPGPLRGAVTVPGDKSISHRALIVGASQPDELLIHNLNPGRDVLATANALRVIGAEVRANGTSAIVRGGTLHAPQTAIDCMNSGSTARMMLGVLSGANLGAQFDGDSSLRRRPMEPVAAQLRAFGARIDTTNGTLPLRLHGRERVETQRFILISQSAQIKSALLFAGLYAGVPIRISNNKGSRDHTERLLRAFGADISIERDVIELRSCVRNIMPIRIPGDFSAAAFFIVAATVAAGSNLTITDVGVNPTRTGLIDALHTMGADITFQNEREDSGEPVADILVKHAALHPTTIGSDVALRMIDEIPVFAVAAAFAHGETRILGVAELRNKESDRVAAIERMLASAGVRTEMLPNGIAVHGGSPAAIDGAVVQPHDDHRTAMSVAALAAGSGRIGIDSDRAIDVSFPGFSEALAKVQA
ncbi:MAG: 3-phosphoshikimate 1-carboxyvinyltransferase [Candidatus Eremiobacteraeota bacterium]|nr:3-phosphoshikimate 1-carboxyvinyltransferase [Candidatus Eremiobacteraeota bacterium]